MELLFIVLFGSIIGLIARYSLPWRSEHGSMLIPSIGAIASAVIWVGLTWLGWKWDGGWIWTVTLIATAVICVVTGLIVGRSRTEADARLLARLGG